ncbi:MAG TPA: CoA transferase [Stellaceae bacterium]|jgi:crotonobetainyl-CoA:carnitine CoA-transferase CaiB-like acyl-CoA transferase
MTIDGAYTGLKVLDFGQGIAAPYCAMLLAMHGAEVTKIEPVAGDWSRGLGTAYGDQTAMSAHYNRGKKSLGLDLKAPAARDIAVSLARAADVVIENNRPGVMGRLGLGYEALKALNPRILYASISGFGQEGPYATLPCTDSVAQAYSGLVALNIGNDLMPHRVGAIIIDTLTGLYAAQALGVALYARERKGVGQRVTVNLAECGAAFLGQKLAEHVLENGAPRVLNVPTGAYRTAEGGWVMIALIREADFGRLVEALGRADLTDDARYASFEVRAANAPSLFEVLRQTIATLPMATVLEKLRAAGVLADRVNGFDDWLADPHVVATGAAVDIAPVDMPAFKVPRTPGVSPEADRALGPAPHVGEHSKAILAGLGMAADRIAALAAERAIGLPGGLR